MKIFDALTTALLLLPTVCFAQGLSLKPGLWEHQVQMKSESGTIEIMLESARAQMAAMPAAQRQMMENMMAQQGLKMDFANQTFQNCISEEDASSVKMNFSKDSGCTQSNIRNEGATTRVSFVCAQTQGEMAFKDGAEYTGNSNTIMTIQGKEELMTATHNGHWVSASCDGIK